MTRRDFLAAGLVAPWLPGVAVGRWDSGRWIASEPRQDAAAEALGLRLGTQAWTFRDRTCFEAIDTAAKLGLKYIELFPGQVMSPGQNDQKIGSDLAPILRAELKAHLKRRGVKAVSFGVVNPGPDEPSMERLIEFVLDMGMETIACEPLAEAWQMLAWRAERAGIALANHNHPKPSTYWAPESVLRQVRGRASRVGACADTGHWVRSGLSPVECLRRYRGRIIELHFKDVRDNQDFPWGTGGGDARGQIEELVEQGFAGHVHVEYEHGSGAELDANVARSIAFFDQTCAAMLDRVKGLSAAERPAYKTEPGWMAKHEAQVEDATIGGRRTVFLGDSITEGWRTAGQASWTRFFGDMRALNVGISGDRTQHTLWRLNAGLIEALNTQDADVQVVVLMIGTNNSNGADHSAEEIAAGIKANVRAIRAGLPRARVLLHAILPRGEGPSEQRAKNAAASKLAAEMADGQTVRYLDLSDRFVDAEGKLNREFMPDLLHLSPKGYEAWGGALRGPLVEMGAVWRAPMPP